MTRRDSPKRDSVGDLVRIGVPAEGGRRPLFIGRVTLDGIHVGICRARLDDIHRDSPLADITGQSFGEANKSGLAHRVERDARIRHTLGEIASDADDPAAGRHVSHRGLARQIHRADVNGEGAVDVLGRHVVDDSERVDARIVDEDVQPTQLVGGLLNRGHHLVGGGAVGLDGEPSTPVGADAVDNLVGSLLGRA